LFAHNCQRARLPRYLFQPCGGVRIKINPCINQTKTACRLKLAGGFL
jgi:hypothetical protein